ncbi:hypothetical protein [Saccharospirillum mangrovi]|uniref:hypothetical protein n=1 Tax=Saccharospirillum mangrovi TaxID=2161747 RepID=UPI000D3D75A8|nr:hypothetical protein [Saccharospirillum mangrovi]
MLNSISPLWAASLVQRLGCVVLMLAGVSACSSERETSSLSNWQGRWWGVEGTYLDIAGGPEQFQLTIANLDGPVQYTAVADGDQLRFDLNGETAVIFATDGVGSGMKWLAEKTNCLKVEPGDGYCRD